MATWILLIDCDDAKGLVHRITGALFERGLNIVSNHEFVDASREHFFMRTTFTGLEHEDDLREELASLLPKGARIQLGAQREKDIVILATKEPHCVGDLLLRHAARELPVRIRAVVSNHAVLEPLVTRFDVPFHHVPHAGLARENHEDAVAEAIAPYRPDWVVLAKYMRILTSGFVARYPTRMINIHHSFLPAFIGANPYRQAFERGVKIIGATAHFVTDSLDEGPILAQSVLPVAHTHSARDMALAGRDVEKVVLARALKLVCEDRVFVTGNRTIIFD